MLYTWLDHYRTTYARCLDADNGGAQGILQPGYLNRAQGFDQIWQCLLSQRSTNFSIIETGCVRLLGNWADGQSTVLLSRFVDWHGGRLRSVDLDPTAVDTVRSCIVSDRFCCHCGDSVAWLESQTDLSTVDLFYLDSYDLDWHNDQASAEHHLREFQTIRPYLKPGALVAIDDNGRWLSSGQRTGKGRLIAEYLQDQGHAPVYDQYQIVYQF